MAKTPYCTRWIGHKQDLHYRAMCTHIPSLHGAAPHQHGGLKNIECGREPSTPHKIDRSFRGQGSPHHLATSVLHRNGARAACDIEVFVPASAHPPKAARGVVGG